jgi:multidrug efflux pump
MTAGVNKELGVKIKDFRFKSKVPDDVIIKQTGQGEQEAETSSFLGYALGNFYGY